MTLSSAFNIATTSFAAIGQQTAIIGSNIANANTPGYSTQIANLATTGLGGVIVDSVSRAASSALEYQVNSSTSLAAMQTAISSGVALLAQTVSDSSSASATSGAQSNGNSPYALLANFSAAISTYEADPSSLSAATAAVTAAQAAASSLNSAASTVQQVRTQADQGIASAVTKVNSLLTQFQTVNNNIIAGTAEGDNVSSLQDQRDSLVTQISQQFGVTTSVNSNGAMSIYTDNGAMLFNITPGQLSFSSATGTNLGPNSVGSAVMLNGQPITGPSAPNPIHSGAVAGLVQLRDQIAPEYQNQLDQISGTLITAFQETDQSTTNTGLPPLAGLFTAPGITSVPPSAQWTGLANTITINASVDPAQSGNPFLLRDGGISDTANSNYTYNTNNNASYTGRLQQYVAALQAPTTFSASAGLGQNGSILSYANASVSWVQATNQQASNSASYQTSLQTQATAALGNATGVNLDAQLTNMLTIESSYQASAKLVTTVTTMLSSLMSSV
jgi:flagellar hook-associated protein 1 FlgK